MKKRKQTYKEFQILMAVAVILSVLSACGKDPVNTTQKLAPDCHDTNGNAVYCQIVR